LNKNAGGGASEQGRAKTKDEEEENAIEQSSDLQ
jgi:hypothetical protein